MHNCLCCSWSNCELAYILCLRETLLSYVTDGDDARALGSLSVLATLLQTKGNNNEVCVTNLFSIAIFLMNIYIVELDESMLDGIGILPQRKQHKKLLLVSFNVSHCLQWE